VHKQFWNSSGGPTNDKGGTVSNIFGYAICVVGAAFGISFAAYAAATNMARQPEVKGNLFTVFILASAFIEALCLIGFVVAIM
jgi:F-type H+-transporting ATPase subunit c